MPFSYPTARLADTAEVLHGVRVRDPYRWLEQADSPETRAWVDAQNALTRSALDGPARDALAERLTTLFNVPRSASPLVRGGRYFFGYNPGIQDHAVMYVQDGPGATPRPLLDPNALSTDGTTALTAVFPSDEGALLAYALSHSGSDRQILRVRDVHTGGDLPDRIEWVKFASLAWTPGGRSFYYLRFPEPGTVPPEDEQYFGRIYLHVLGTGQADDRLVFEYPSQKEVVPLVDVTANGATLVITCQRGASDDSEIYLLDPAGGAPRALFTGFEAAYTYIGSAPSAPEGVTEANTRVLLFRTTQDAPLGRVIAVTSDRDVRDVIPEMPDRLGDVVVARATLAAVYLRNASSDLRLFDLAGTLRGSVALPGLGTIATIDAHPTGDDIAFTFTSFTQPSTAYVLPPEGGSHTLSVVRPPKRGSHALPVVRPSEGGSHALPVVRPPERGSHTLPVVRQPERGSDTLPVVLQPERGSHAPAVVRPPEGGSHALPVVLQPEGGSHALPVVRPPEGGSGSHTLSVVRPPEGGSHTSTSISFTTTQVWFPSRDGTTVSMFLVHRADMRPDGRRPVLLSGYGGFNISRTPQFDPALFPLLDRGGIFALANLRGGGEYGEAWHQAGMLERKQNVFDDFIAAAEFLVREGYTSAEHLAIEGGSNGGLLVGAALVQRPDLFGAVVCRVPVADMLRYHLFTVGRFWIPEYGSADDAEQFAYLLRYSPYHNVRPGTRYPPTLIMTADTDDRVDPGMAKKFAARLQAEGAGGPILLRVEMKAGHGAGKPVTKVIQEDADILAFLERFVMQP